MRPPVPAFRLIPLALLAFLLSGCGVFSRGETAIPAEAGKILIRYQWTAADTETPPVAFHVYRSSSAAGPFRRLTSEPVKTGTHKAGETFVLFKDVGVQVGGTYYYYLERAGPRGERFKWTSVTPARAILPLDSKDLKEYRRWQDAQRKTRRGLDS